MDKLPANIVDLIVLAIITLSALLALSRGFTREVLSILGWIAAIFATLYGFSLVIPYVRQVIAYDILANSVAGIGIFVATLASISLISGIIARRLHKSTLGALDRSLGLLFGLLRGMVFVCLGFLFVHWIYGEDPPPDWLAEARFAPVLETGGKFLLSLAPEYFTPHHSSVTQPGMSENLKNIWNHESIQKEVDLLSNPQPEPGKTVEDTGYSRQERREMDRLHHTFEDK